MLDEVQVDTMDVRKNENFMIRKNEYNWAICRWESKEKYQMMTTAPSSTNSLLLFVRSLHV